MEFVKRSALGVIFIVIAIGLTVYDFTYGHISKSDIELAGIILFVVVILVVAFVVRIYRALRGGGASNARSNDKAATLVRAPEESKPMSGN